MKILITGACGVTSRAVSRSLKLSERFCSAELVGTDIAENLYGLYEGMYERIYRVPQASDGDYLPIIQGICADEAPDLAIVIPEPEVLFWAEHTMPVQTLLPPPKFSRIAISKKRVYEMLSGTGLVPSFTIVSREDILAGRLSDPSGHPVWIRDYKEGSTSGKGALNVKTLAEMQAWATLNPNIDQFMVADYLPGRNLACCLLFHFGKLLKVASYERLEYFMGRTVMSGVSGNISRGRLINDTRTSETAEKAVRLIADTQLETMHGLVTVDLKEDVDGNPLVTEINLRHVACTSAFAAGGANMSEAQLLVTLGDLASVGDREVTFPPTNLILRDIDGLPIWVCDHHEIQIGQCV